MMKIVWWNYEYNENSMMKAWWNYKQDETSAMKVKIWWNQCYENIVLELETWK